MPESDGPICPGWGGCLASDLSEREHHQLDCHALAGSLTWILSNLPLLQLTKQAAKFTTMPRGHLSRPASWYSIALRPFDRAASHHPFQLTLLYRLVMPVFGPSQALMVGYLLYAC